MPTVLKVLFLLLAGSAAGVMNAVAGGGTLITFPTLVFIGVPAVVANATNTVAVTIGIFASLWSYRRELASQEKWAWRFAPPSLVGGLLGAILLLHTSEGHFRQIIPYLILFATVLFTIQPAVSRRLQIETQAAQQSHYGLSAAIVFQFFVGVYGGYFGAGIGILMLAVLGILGHSNIHEMNSLRVLLGVLINVVASIYFIANGRIVWIDVLLIAAGAVVGGYFGPILGRKAGAAAVRGFIAVTGFALGFYFLFQ